MLYAAARSVRKESSRQRYSLQDFSLIRVSLVKGKTGWRVGSVMSVRNYFADAVDKSARGSVVKLFRLLRRFYSGEESAPALFDYFKDSLALVSEVSIQRGFVERVIESHILLELGYVDPKSVPAVVIDTKPLEIASQYSSVTLKNLEKITEKAISTSHL